MLWSMEKKTSSRTASMLILPCMHMAN